MVKSILSTQKGYYKAVLESPAYTGTRNAKELESQLSRYIERPDFRPLGRWEPMYKSKSVSSCVLKYFQGSVIKVMRTRYPNRRTRDRVIRIGIISNAPEKLENLANVFLKNFPSLRPTPKEPLDFWFR